MTATFLSRYTPSLNDPEALEAIFVQREGLAQRRIEQIRQSALTPAKHYSLLVGPRGIGKTHLVSLLYHRLKKMEDLRDRLLIAWLREEEWGAATFLDLLIKILNALSREYGDEALAERVEALYGLGAPAAQREAGRLLKEYVGERTLLLLAENLDELFDQIGAEGQKRLRAYIQENPFFAICATSQSLTGAFTLQTSPFYGFFTAYHLEELTREESVELLRRIAEHQNDRELADFIASPAGQARIRALRHLAGGNPRIYVVFSQFLTRESLDQLVDPFLEMLDDLTPYYQDRLRTLSPQQRKIVEFLCDHAAPAQVKEIAQRCFMTPQTASSQLKELRQRGYAQSIEIGREAYYELREPLMRLVFDVKKNRGEPVRLIVDFLRLWHAPSKLRRKLACLTHADLTERIYLAEALQPSLYSGRASHFSALEHEFMRRFEAGDYNSALTAAAQLVAARCAALDWYAEAICLSELRKHGEALECLNRAIEADPHKAFFWYNRALLLWSIGQLHDAELSCLEAANLEANNIETWDTLGKIRTQEHFFEDAIAAFDRSICLDPRHAPAWSGRGFSLAQLGRFGEALESLDHALEISPADALIWYQRGYTLLHLGRLKEAHASYCHAADLNPDDPLSWSNRGVTAELLTLHDDALFSFSRALSLDSRRMSNWMNKAGHLLHVGQHREGIVLLEQGFTALQPSADALIDPTEDLLASLLRAPTNTWRESVRLLAGVYSESSLVSALAQALAKTISFTLTAALSEAALEEWRQVWREVAAQYSEIDLPSRLLETALLWKRTSDPRSLLALPAEERKILVQLTGIQELSAGSGDPPLNTACC